MGFIKNRNKNALKAILSLEPILARRWKLQEYDRILTKLGFNDLLQLESPPQAHASEEKDFTFPNGTDVFGWTEDYWEIFNSGIPKGNNIYKTLDLAGQSVLYHAIDRTTTPKACNYEVDLAKKLVVQFGNHGLLTARCDKKTPLHRAAKTSIRSIIHYLLEQDADFNAADLFGRTTLCLAAHHGHD